MTDICFRQYFNYSCLYEVLINIECCTAKQLLYGLTFRKSHVTNFLPNCKEIIFEADLPVDKKLIFLLELLYSLGRHHCVSLLVSFEFLYIVKSHAVDKFGGRTFDAIHSLHQMDQILYEHLHFLFALYDEVHISMSQLKSDAIPTLERKLFNKFSGCWIDVLSEHPKSRTLTSIYDILDLR